MVLTQNLRALPLVAGKRTLSLVNSSKISYLRRNEV